MNLQHLTSMCDDTGLFQHAVHSVPDRSHGYCVDDNARALLLACALNAAGEECLPDALTARFAAFLQHADGFFVWRHVIVRRARREPQPKARELACTVFSAFLQRMKTRTTRSAKQRVSKHR